MFVHGCPVNATGWKVQMEGLASEFRVTAFDLPGYPDRFKDEVARFARSLLQGS